MKQAGIRVNPILIGALALAVSGRAATIDTYDFSQSGYQANGAVFNPLVGSFSGQVEANGLIEISDLTSFVGISIDNQRIACWTTYARHRCAGILFLQYPGRRQRSGPGGPAADGEIKVCVGAAAAFGGTIAGVNCGPGGSTGYIFFAGGSFAETNELQQIRLVDSVTTPAPAAAAEPGTLPLFASALILLGAAQCGPTMLRDDGRDQRR